MARVKAAAGVATVDSVTETCFTRAMTAMEDKRTRILETAIELAEQGGFEAVRLRDVAAQAEVALGTLYKRFRSKEDLLIAALELEAEKLDKRMEQKPATGHDPLDRVLAFFEIATKALFRKPNLARAVLRSLTSGDEQLTAKVAGFHDRIARLIIASMRGVGTLTPTSREATNTEQMVAFILEEVWFASLVGWMGGLTTKAMVIEQLRIAMTLLMKGVDLDKESV